MDKDSTNQFLLLTDRIVNLTQQKNRIEAELELCLQKQRELVGKKIEPVQGKKRSRPKKPTKAVSRQTPPDSGFYAAVGREIQQLESGVAYFGDRLRVYEWGAMEPQMLLEKVYASSEAHNLKGELSVVPLTPDQVEVFSMSKELTLYCKDFGISRDRAIA